jgi:Transcription factor WhiB
MNNPWKSLFGALNGIPALEDAICAGDTSGIWDAADAADTALAVRICRRCPAMDDCRAWARAQPKNSMSGVIGAELYTWVSQPRRKFHQSEIATTESEQIA